MPLDASWTEPPANYDSDLFRPILSRVGELAGTSYEDLFQAVLDDYAANG